MEIWVLGKRRGRRRGEGGGGKEKKEKEMKIVMTYLEQEEEEDEEAGVRCSVSECLLVEGDNLELIVPASCCLEA